MKKRTMIVSALLLIAFLLIQGCAGTPEPVEPEKPVEQPEPAVDEKADIAAPENERAQAVSLRAIIMETEPDLSQTDNFLLAEEAFNSAELAYGSDNMDARELYLEAIEGYRSVLDTTYGAQIKERRSVSLKEKEAADALFASKAAPESYVKGESSLKEAEALSSEYHYPDALGAYRNAEAFFKEAAEIAGQKKRVAMEALENAQAAYKRTEDDLKEEESRLSSEREETEEETRREYESADIELEEEETE
jgi:hypothetical protein